MSSPQKPELVDTICSNAADDRLFKLSSTVRRKVDLRLIPWLTILYLSCFLYISLISSFQITGMAEDLKLSGMRYQMAAAAFFLTYSLFEIPCNVLLQRLRPSIWIPSITLAWGIVMVSMAFVQTWQGLIIARLFLGVAESGLGPGLAYYITLWYCRDQQARPIAFYFSAATLSGPCLLQHSGLLAFCIEKMNGLCGLHGWQWIFLLEGLLTVVVALVSFWAMIDYPDTATFLTPEEREHLIDVLGRDTAGEPSHFDMKFVWETIWNPKSWLHAAIFVGIVAPLYSFSLFVPTIIHALGFSANNAQLLTIPPYAAGCAVTIIIGALSDRARMRGPFIAALSLVGIVGYIILLGTDAEKQPAVGYAGCVIAAMGIYPGVPLILAWSAANARGSLKKAVVFALVNMVGNFGGICASFVYRTQDTPQFTLGHSVSLGFMCLACLGSLFATLMYRRLNQGKERLCAEQNISLDRKAEFSAMGVESPVFR
ncbi:MFS general substrate transporter [Mycena pura]|uniref:MFS general substrate transporter n=1 Tax=Mycena pura TaxID=153505 RepID=A0AAD6YVT2_9AGAR|nr:MFS general substrate transporter [Mycena pura]